MASPPRTIPITLRLWLLGHGGAVSFLFLLAISMVSLTSITGFKVKMIPRDSPESPLYQGNLTESERLKYRVRLTKDRVHALQLTALSSVMNKSYPPDEIRPAVSANPYLYYMILVKIGSQQDQFFLMIDSGSDTTWVQCEGCSPYFQLRGSNFKRFKSNTYSQIPRNHPLCPPIISDRPFCEYRINYGEGGQLKTRGILATDDFTFPTSIENVFETKHFVFGCGLSSEGIRFGKASPDNQIAGIFGLGGGRRSFIAQMGYKRFSYYLSEPGAISYLYFGDDANFGEGEQVTKVPFVTTAFYPSLYYLNVIDISVDGQQLYIPPDIFRATPDGEVGFIIDSGSPNSFLSIRGYDFLEQGVAEYFSKYNLRRAQSARLSYPLCYYKPYNGFQSEFPEIKFFSKMGLSLLCFMMLLVIMMVTYSALLLHIHMIQ